MGIFVEILPALIRYALAGWAATLIEKGIITADQFDRLVFGLALAAATLVWMVWVKVKDRIKVNTALAMPPGSTVDDLKDNIAKGMAAKATTPTSLPPRLPIVLLAIALGATTLAGCGAKLPKLPDVPAAVEASTDDVKAGAAKGLIVLRDAGKLANDFSKAEDEAARSGTLPASVDAQFDAFMRRYADHTDQAIAKIQAGVASWEQLKAIVDPVVDDVRQISTLVQSLRDAGGTLKAWLVRLRDVLLGGLSEAVGEAMFGGAR